MLRGVALERFAKQHRLPFLHIAELVEYRQATASSGLIARSALERLSAERRRSPTAA